MIAYLIKTVACSGIFLLAHLLFFEREKMHRFNRWYLLGAVGLSFIIPLITIPVSQELLLPLNDAYIIIGEPGNVAATQSASATAVDATIQPATGFRIPIWMLVYIFITLLFFIRFTRNIYLLLKAVLTREISHYKGVSLVVVKGDISSYTFFNTIFISEADYPSDGDESAILTHEIAHVRQKHSWDVLFIELVKVFCWFNPLFIFYKKAIQLNHEFLADDAAIKDHTDIPAYQYLLLDKIGRGLPMALTSSFNYSITKKRLTMMTRQSNRSISLIKQLSIIPLLTIIVFLFCSREIIAQENKVESTKPGMAIQKSPQADTHRLPPLAYLKIMFGNPAEGPGASNEEIAEYTTIIDRNLKKTGSGAISMPLTPEERNNMYRLYAKMTLKQRSEREIIFIKRLSPVKKVPPTAEQIEKWKNPANYGVWIDGKKIANEKLNEYRYTDFGHYDSSNLNYNEKMKKDIMKRYNLKVMYQVQVNIMTVQAYEKHYKASMAEPPYSMLYHQKHDTTGKPVRNFWIKIPEQKETR